MPCTSTACTERDPGVPKPHRRAHGLRCECYVLYVSFFSALLSGEIRIGKSPDVSCVGVLALEIIAVVHPRRLAPRLFERGRRSAWMRGRSGLPPRYRDGLSMGGLVMAEGLRAL
jgi:hypothetical protein